MEIVIDIPEEEYRWIKKSDKTVFADVASKECMLHAIKNGILLPKGHGRLCDMDELVKNIVKEYGVNSIHELPQDIKMFYEKFINSAPTILDATFDYKLRNYAFFRKEKE